MKIDFSIQPEPKQKKKTSEISSTPKPRKKSNATEFYPTPIPVATAFARSGRIPLTGRFLEPCIGQGAIVTGINRYCLSKAIPAPIWTGIELHPELAKTATVRCPQASIFCGSALTAPLDTYDVIITNPPFSLAAALYQRLRPLSTYLVFLLRVGWLESGCRQELLSKDVPALGLISPRPSFSESGNDNATYAWMVWGPERKTSSEFWICRTIDEGLQPTLF